MFLKILAKIIRFILKNVFPKSLKRIEEKSKKLRREEHKAQVRRLFSNVNLTEKE